jgi:hypothetical protein
MFLCIPEEKRVFLEEVVRAEIRGRLQGQEALARRVMEVEEMARGDAARYSVYLLYWYKSTNTDA